MDSHAHKECTGNFYSLYKAIPMVNVKLKPAHKISTSVLMASAARLKDIDAMLLVPSPVPIAASAEVAQLVQHRNLRVVVQVMPVYAACSGACACSYCPVKVHSRLRY